jgi:thiamine-phosphate pyrophosphorylase
MTAPILRLLDANANRAREALRVTEDYARFILNNADLSRAIKSLRHDMAQILGPILAESILFRDTENDVGTEIEAAAEMSRTDLGEVVTAAAKRTGEALRAIEEYLKTLDSVAARKIEHLRYRWYEIERKLAMTLRADGRFASVRLYVLITESLCENPWLKTAELAIDGGADCLQLREKNLESGELLSRARQLVELCRNRSVLCIINDRPDIAFLSDADGVHVGQGDLPVREARKILGANKIVGQSTHDLAQARQAVLDGADYIGVGPVFKSATKPRDFLPGLEFARQAAKQISIPKVAIAGITAENVDEVMKTGINAVAVSSGIIGFADTAGAAREIKERMKLDAAKG